MRSLLKTTCSQEADSSVCGATREELCCTSECDKTEEQATGQNVNICSKVSKVVEDVIEMSSIVM